MRRLWMLLGLCGLLLVIGVGIVAAQDLTCPVIVEQALAQTMDLCAGGDVLCYGSASVDITLYVGTGSLTPDAPGEIVPISQVESFRTLPLDDSVGTYGVALATRDLPGADDVLFLFFGDVEVNLAPGPVIGMETFTFSSGLYDASCDDAPDSGLLIHSPGFAPALTIINGVDINLMGTAFVQAQPGVDIAVQVISGQAEVGYGDSIVSLTENESARVMLTDDFTPIGDVLIKDYELVTTLALPLAILPETTVTTITPTDDLPISGEWRTISDTCDLHTVGGMHTVTMSRDGQTLVNGTAEYVLIEPGRYRYDFGSGWWDAIVISSTLIEFVNDAHCSTRSELVTPAE